MKKKLFSAAAMALASTALSRTPAFNFFARQPTEKAAGAEDKTWYRIQRNAKSSEADVFIYSEIGYWGVNAQQFVADLNELDVKVINLHVNSPGGSVFEGLAIYNGLASHSAKIVAHIDGYAASIASVIICAADEIKIGEAAQVMIHQPWSFVMGPADDMRKEADVLDSIEEAIIDVYVARTGGDRKALEKQVKEETWFKGQAAVDAGFADEVIPLKLKPADKAKANLPGEFFNSIFKHMPDDIELSTPEEATAAASIETLDQFESFLRKNGYGGRAAKNIATHGFKATTESPEGTKPPGKSGTADRPEDAAHTESQATDRPEDAVRKAADIAGITTFAMTFPRS